MPHIRPRWQRFLYLAAVPIAFLCEMLAAPRATEACPVQSLLMPDPAQRALSRRMESCVLYQRKLSLQDDLCVAKDVFSGACS